MPTIAKYLGYNIYIWSNEGNPVEPIHVHVAKTPSSGSDKFWITSDGLVIPCMSNGALSRKDTAKVISYLTDESIQKIIIDEWLTRFGKISYIE